MFSEEEGGRGGEGVQKGTGGMKWFKSKCIREVYIINFASCKFCKLIVFINISFTHFERSMQKCLLMTFFSIVLKETKFINISGESIETCARIIESL